MMSPMKRLCILVPDVASAQRVIDALLGAGLMYIAAALG
jgi:hypothetical protein